MCERIRRTEWGRKGERPMQGFHYCAPRRPEWLCHVGERLLCGRSASLAAFHPPDNLSTCLQQIHDQRFTFNYLLSQTHTEEVQKHRIQAFLRFYPLALLFGSSEWVERRCVCQPYCDMKWNIFVSHLIIILTAVSLLKFPFATHNCPSCLWYLDGLYLSLKEECWPKSWMLIYDVICNLTFLPKRYCQDAMVIKQQIQFRHSGTQQPFVSV